MDNAGRIIILPLVEKNRRRKYIVSPIQVRMAIWAVLLFAAGVIAIWWEVQGDLKELQNTIGSNYQDPTLTPYIASYGRLITQGIVLKSIFVMMVILVAVLYIFHHFLGPIYRLKICLKSIQDGDLACRMHLRKHDYLTDVADSFNAMASALQQQNKK
jgi:methyl-accepting chemotaxis protein